MAKRKQPSRTLSATETSGIPPAVLKRSFALAGVAALFIVIWCAYAPAATSGFILDDDKLVTNNAFIARPDGIYHIWLTTHLIDYWPVTNTAFWLEWRIFLTCLSPENVAHGFHVVNIGLHCVEAGLLWLILSKLKIPGAYFAAFLFALHPANVESVAWISSQKNLWALLFAELAVLCYLKIELPERGSLSNKSFAVWYALTLVCFVAATFGKGSAVIVPGILALVVMWLRPPRKSDLYLLSPFFVLAVPLAMVNVWFQTHGLDVHFREAGVMERIAAAAGMVWFYAYKSVWPFDLSLIYPKWTVSWMSPLWIVAIAGVPAVTAALTYLFIRGDRRGRPLFFIWAFFCVALIPNLGFSDVGYMKSTLVADRYLHFSLIAVAAGVAAGWATLRDRLPSRARMFAYAAPLVILSAFAYKANAQTTLYKDALTWYAAALEKNPDSWLAQNNYGYALLQAGQIDAAMERYKIAMRLAPDYQDAYNNMGSALLKHGKPAEAIPYLRKALALSPTFLGAKSNLGVALMQTHNREEGLRVYQEIIAESPDNPDYFNNLGGIYAMMGDDGKALEQFDRATALFPDHYGTAFNRALALFSLGRKDEAIKQALIARDLSYKQNQIEFAKKIENWLQSPTKATGPSAEKSSH